MFYVNPGEILSVFLAVKYTHKQNAECDYSAEPRPCHNFVFMLNGEGMVRSNGENFHVRPGEILYIPKDSKYSAKWFASPEAAYHSLHFSFQPKFDPCKNKTIPGADFIRKRFSKAVFAFAYDRKVSVFERRKFVFRAFGVFRNMRKSATACENFRRVARKSNASARRQLYRAGTITGDFRWHDLAALCYLSPSRFYYLFKKYTHVTPVEYKNKIAVQRAAQDLLYSKQTSITEIAAKHGFSSVIYFERLFKKTTGKSPSQYRKDNLL